MTGDDTDITIPVENVLTSLLLLILPVIPGLLLGKYMLLIPVNTS